MLKPHEKWNFLTFSGLLLPSFLFYFMATILFPLYIIYKVFYKKTKIKTNYDTKTSLSPLSY